MRRAEFEKLQRALAAMQAMCERKILAGETNVTAEEITACFGNVPTAEGTKRSRDTGSQMTQQVKSSERQREIKRLEQVVRLNPAEYDPSVATCPCGVCECYRKLLREQGTPLDQLGKPNAVKSGAGNCREAGPGRGLCVECADGNYEKCLYLRPEHPESNTIICIHCGWETCWSDVPCTSCGRLPLRTGASHE